MSPSFPMNILDCSDTHRTHSHTDMGKRARTHTTQTPSEHLFKSYKYTLNKLLFPQLPVGIQQTYQTHNGSDCQEKEGETDVCVPVTSVITCFLAAFFLRVIFWWSALIWREHHIVWFLSLTIYSTVLHINRRENEESVNASNYHGK